MTRSRIVVYDPDDLNPYGRELAALLEKGGDVYVSLFCPRHVEWVPEEISEHRARILLRPAAKGARLLVNHLITLTLVLVRACRGSEVIAVWQRSALDDIAFGLLAWFGRAPIVLVHNPGARMPSKGLRRYTYPFLLSRSRVVVHSQGLQGALPPKARNRAVVIPHLPFQEWALAHTESPRYAEKGGDEPPRPPRPPRLIFVGHLRSDKGLEDLHDVIEGAVERGPVSVRFAGRGREIPQGLPQRPSVQYEDMLRPEGLSDTKLWRAIRDADVLVAPYSGATQSGSITLALSLGKPVASYRSGAIEDLLPDTWLVPVGEARALGRLAVSLVGQEERVDLRGWSAICSSRWLELLA